MRSITGTSVSAGLLAVAVIVSACVTAGCSGGGNSGVSSPPPALQPVGNGKTDDYPAIQAEIDAASSNGGGIVTLPAGTFLINGHLQMRSNVTLQGAGASTIIKAGPEFLNTTGPAGGYPVITTDGATNVEIKSLTADQSGDTLNGNVTARLNEYLVDVRNSTNATVDGVSTINPFSYSIAVVGSSHFTVKNCHTEVTSSGKYNQLDGIHVLNSSFGTVSNNVVDQGIGTDGDDGLVAHTINGSTHDVSYTNNTVRGGSKGSAMQFASGAATDTIYNITVANNLFWGSPLGVRTGSYSGPGGAISAVTIGGSPGAGNCFQNNGGNAVDFSGNLQNITVTYNSAENSGDFVVAAGSGNVVASNTTAATSCPATAGAQSAAVGAL